MSASHLPGAPLAYRPDIDGLRAIAVTLVVLVHAFPKLVPNGHVGVDIFFVISGYLITSILRKELRDGRFSLRTFYVRRANRIFPALVLVLLACLGFGAVALYAGEYQRLGRSVAAGAGFVANIHFFLEGGYWDVADKLKPLLHLWSLGVEEQFYLLWPLLLWLAWSRRLAPLLVLVIVASSFVWSVRSTAVNQSAAFFLPLARFWELLAGGALALLHAHPADPDARASAAVHAWRYWWARLWVRNAASALGLALLTAALADRYPRDQFPGWHALPAVLGAVLLIAAGHAAWPNARVLSRRAIVYVGLLSYPLYLWHWPLLSFARIVGDGDPSLRVRIAAVATAVGLAMGTYHLLELPLRRAPIGRARLACVLAAVLAVCGVGGWWVEAQGGLPARYAAAPARPADPPMATTGPVLAILGDSQASVYASFMPFAPRRLAEFSTAGWPYLAGTEFTKRNPPGTPQLTDQVLHKIAADPAIDIVVIATMYNLYTDFDKYNAGDRFRSVPPQLDETSAQAYYAGLRRTAAFLSAAGKTIVYFKSIPFLGGVQSAEACAGPVLPVHRAAPAACTPSRTEIDAFRNGYDESVAKSLRGIPNVHLFDPVPLLCDAQACHAAQDGVVLYRDSAHLTPVACRQVGRHLMTLVDALRARRVTAQAGN